MITSRSFVFVKGTAVAVALLLMGAGCARNITTTPSSQGYFADTAYSLPVERWDQGVTYEDQIKMDAPAVWETVQIGTTLVEVPYSSDWTVDKRKVLPLNQRGEVASSDVDIAFGRYVGAGTYFAREYALEVKHRLFQIGESILDDPSEGPLPNEGPEIRDPQGNLLTKPRTPVTIGDVKGVSYLSCGAKGCVTMFFGYRGQYTIMLRKLYPMGQDDFTHTITPEMERIIRSVKSVEESTSAKSTARISAGPLSELIDLDKQLIQRAATDGTVRSMNIPTSWRLPDGVGAPQLRNGYSLNEELAFAFVERHNMNKPLYDDQGNLWQELTTSSGVIFTADRGQTWKKSFEIPARIGACVGVAPGEERERFNPVGMFWENKKFYLDIADDCGAGSGEGNLIRYSTTDGAKWKRESCYYLVPQQYYDFEFNENGAFSPLKGLPKITNPHQLRAQACPKG